MAALFGAFRCERDGPAQQPFRLFETAAFQLQMSRHAVGLGIVGIKTRGGEEILETLGPLARRQPPMRPVKVALRVQRRHGGRRRRREPHGDVQLDLRRLRIGHAG